GGGLTLRDGTVTVRSTSFSNNRAVLQGGGLFIGSNSVFDGCTCDGNQSSGTGGVVYVDQHAPTSTDSTISRSTSVNDGGGIYIHQSTITFADNRVTDNASGDD